ncbi:MAG: type VI secretion system baseplate subunit TssK [Nannocystaceae bacterium]|nr:type VI secretion system baseplate subunit TssK [Nannocystaceae bacterium]
MARKRADRVLWGEGLLVCPQHFQQHDLFLDANFQARAMWPNPYAWGVVTADLDSAGLKTGALAVKSFRGLLPQGLALDLEEGDPDLPPSRPIADSFPSTAAVLEVFLAVPALREGGENCATGESGAGSHRYTTWSREVLDLVDAGTEVNVSYARPQPVILFGHENRDDFEVLKLAELKRDGAGGFETTSDFVPTCLRMSGSALLRKWTSELVSLMVTKRRALMEALGQVDSARVEFTAQDVTRSLQLGTINTHLPMVRHMSENPETPPFWLFSSLSQLAGQLATFSSTIAPEALPTYHHPNPRETFVELFAKLRELLELAMQQNFIEVPLEARRDGMWIGLLKEDRLLACPTFVLAVEADTAQQEVANRIPQLSKIASWQQIARIVRSAIPGAPLKATHRPPPEVPIRPNSVYFLVDTKHDFWKQVLEERAVAIFLPPPYDPSRARVKLIAIPAGKGR